MQWVDKAIILSLRKFDETAAVACLFSREHGLYHGVCKAALSKANRGTYQSGNLVLATWKARLAEHLGTLSTDLLDPIAALALQDPKALAGLNAICALLQISQNERDPHPELYDKSEALLKLLAHGGEWLPYYVHFELEVLATLGFKLDLSQCAATGVTEDLCYVSPKSGRAVSREAGEVYHDKMLPLSTFLQNADKATNVSDKDLADGLRTTGYFLAHVLRDHRHKEAPAARARLLSLIAPSEALIA